MIPPNGKISPDHKPVRNRHNRSASGVLDLCVRSRNRKHFQVECLSSSWTFHPVHPFKVRPRFSHWIHLGCYCPFVILALMPSFNLRRRLLRKLISVRLWILNSLNFRSLKSEYWVGTTWVSVPRLASPDQIRFWFSKKGKRTDLKRRRTLKRMSWTRRNETRFVLSRRSSAGECWCLV